MNRNRKTQSASASSAFAEIKAGVAIADVLRDYGVEVDRSHKALCPLHSEKTPSFSVSPDKGLWYCFGCGEGGDVITLVARLERCRPLEAAKLLARRYGLTVFDEDDTESRKRNRQKRRIREHRAKVREEDRLWREQTFCRLYEARRLKFQAGEDCSYEDYLIDLFESDPLAFRAQWHESEEAGGHADLGAGTS